MKSTRARMVIIITTLSVPLITSAPALAATTASVSNVQNFIQSVIEALAGLAGLIATGFFVLGGFHYITSSGNPEHLDRAKKTLFFSALGLCITIAAFVLSTIVTSLATNAFGS
jgi:hypothetical protein